MADRPEILTQASEQILRRLGGAADAERFRAPPPDARDRTAELDRLRDGGEWDEAAVSAAFAGSGRGCRACAFSSCPATCRTS